MRILRLVDENLERWLLTAVFTMMCVLVGMQVIFRYLLNLPLAWTEELSRYIFIWMIYLGAALAIKRRRHLKVDAVLLLFGPRGRFAMRLISNVLTAVFCAVVTVLGSDVLYLMAKVRVQYSPVLSLPMAWVYGVLPACGALMLVRLVQDTALLVREHLSGADDADGRSFIQKQVNEDLSTNG